MRSEAKAFNLDLVVTRACPLACRYCRVARRGAAMPRRVWRRALELLLEEEGPLELQFLGGEPLVEYDLVREVAGEAVQEAFKKGKALRAMVTTNGLLLHPERSRELAELGCSVMFSMDGGRDAQRAQRPARGGGPYPWKTLLRNLEGLLGSGAPSFVNLVVTPESAAHVAENAAFLIKEGVRALQVSCALGVHWSQESLRVLEEQLSLACRLADSSRPRVELFNRKNDVEPVLLDPQHVVDADGQLYVGNSFVLEEVWPELHQAFRVGDIFKMKRLPGRRAAPARQLRRLRDAKVEGAAREVLLNNVAAGHRLRRFWNEERGRPAEVRPRPEAAALAGEATDRRALLERLARLGVQAGDPFRGGFIGEVYLMLTMNCNLRCRACSLWGLGGACHAAGFYEAASRPAAKERFLSFIDEIASYRPQNLNLSGGEPLLSPLWPDLAARARQRGLRTILTTNGVLLERHAEEVADLFDQVSVSVACPPGLREELRMGPPGHYDAMTRGLRRLAELRDGRGGRKPLLRLLCEIFDSNAGHLGEIVEHLEKEGVAFDEILFQHLIFNRPRELAAQESAFRDEFDLPLALWRGYGYQPRPMDFSAFDRALESLRRRYPQACFSVDLRGPEALRDYYQGSRGKAGAAFCDGPWTQVSVLPNGDVWVCPDFILGSVAEKSFAEIWDGPMARALRRRVWRSLFPACRGCFLFYGKEQPVAPEACV